MRIRINKKQAALVIAVGLAAFCTLNAAAAGAKATPMAVQAVGNFVLQRTEDTANAVTLRYKSAEGEQISVTYTRGGKASSKGLRQYTAQPLLYACYSDNFTSEKISTVYYTVGNCMVEVNGLDENGNSAALDKDEMLTFLTQLQKTAVPVPVGTCARCSGDTYCQSVSVGEWKKISSAPCSHGGGLKYTDTKQQRTVKVHRVCVDCGHVEEESTTQTGTYCSYSGQWQMS
jgi:hypothetical protein